MKKVVARVDVLWDVVGHSGSDHTWQFPCGREPAERAQVSDGFNDKFPLH